MSPSEKGKLYVDCRGYQPQSRKVILSPCERQKMSELQRFQCHAGEAHRSSSVHGKGAGALSIRDCSKQLSTADLQKHYAECADKDSWFTMQQNAGATTASTIQGARKCDARGNMIDLTLDTRVASSGDNAEQAEKTDNVFDIFNRIEEGLYGNPLYIAEQNFGKPSC